MSNPADLNTVPQPDTDKNFFNFKATNLKINETYAIKFQWVYSDGTVSDWSPGYFITTSNETAPAVPTSASVPSTSTGSIPVTLSAFPTNAKRVDVVITNGIFGTATVAHSFTTVGTITIAAPAGSYIVQLRSISPTGVTSTVGTTFTITVSDVGETIQAPTNPNGFTSKRILAGIEVSWAGTYASSTFTGFEAINIYAGNSATATNGTYEQVGVLTGNNVKNTIVVPLGTYVAYGQAVYIHAAAVNKNGTVGTIQANVTNQALGPGKATDADINDGAVVISKLASDVLTVGNLKAGDINATSFIRAGTAGSARVELSSANITSGPSAGFYIYNSAGTAILSAPLTGGLSITGGGTFSGNLSAAGGTFTGTLSAASGSFSGSVTASSGSIGNWQINSGVLKSGVESFPRVLLDPTNSQIVLRQTEGATDSGNLIKLDPSVGIKVGTTALPKFTVDMSGNMSATDGTFSSGSFNGNITSSATITGGTIRTKSSGERIEISGADDSIYFYSGSGSETSPGEVSTFLATISGSVLSQVAMYSHLLSGNSGQGGVSAYALSGNDYGVIINGKDNYVNTGTFRISENYSGITGSGSSGYVRNAYVRPTSDGAPSSGTGINGDLWIQY
jgi:hypothetical protein